MEEEMIHPLVLPDVLGGGDFIRLGPRLRAFWIVQYRMGGVISWIVQGLRSTSRQERGNKQETKRNKEEAELSNAHSPEANSPITSSLNLKARAVATILPISIPTMNALSTPNTSL
jgi:hypothetical protein